MYIFSIANVVRNVFSLYDWKVIGLGNALTSSSSSTMEYYILTYLIMNYNYDNVGNVHVSECMMISFPLLPYIIHRRIVSRLKDDTQQQRNLFLLIKYPQTMLGNERIVLSKERLLHEI